MSNEPLPQSEFILYQTEDGRTRIQCRFENETVWLSQKLMAELFGKDIRTINEHIQNVFAEGELVADSVIRKFRITAADGKSYATQHYNLDVRKRTAFRISTARLNASGTKRNLSHNESFAERAVLVLNPLSML